MNNIIHYCWFGGNPKTSKILQCIESWKKFFPGWKIIEWNESNFDTKKNLYVRQAYESEKWAFVSDYVRFWALEKYGGIYFDTDVEVIRSFDDLLCNDAFSGFESDTAVAPGLVLYSKNPEHFIIREAREWYEYAKFLDDDGNRIRINVCGIFKEIIQKHGFQPNGKTQSCDGMIIYAKDYFCPFDDATGVLKITENTYSIHWYDKSWMPKSRIFRNRCSRILHRLFGVDVREKVMKLTGKPVVKN